MIQFHDLLVCHLIGDFLLQNNWMQSKSKNSFACLAHVDVYCIPFCLIGTPLLVATAIMIQHFLQDRFALHLKWMKFFKQTTPDKWPVGPLVVDQCFHIAYIWAVYKVYLIA